MKWLQTACKWACVIFHMTAVHQRCRKGVCLLVQTCHVTAASQASDSSVELAGFRPEGASLKPPLWGFSAVPGCPCTPELLCSLEEERPLYGVAGSGCINPPAPKAATYAVHGGAGLLLTHA